MPSKIVAENGQSQAQETFAIRERLTLAASGHGTGTLIGGQDTVYRGGSQIIPPGRVHAGGGPRGHLRDDGGCHGQVKKAEVLGRR